MAALTQAEKDKICLIIIAIGVVISIFSFLPGGGIWAR